MALLGELTSSQLAWWEAYSEVEPWGGQADDYRSAVQTAAALAPWKKKGERLDFGDWFESLKVERDEEYQDINPAAFLAHTLAVGGTVVWGSDGGSNRSDGAETEIGG